MVMDARVSEVKLLPPSSVSDRNAVNAPITPLSSGHIHPRSLKDRRDSFATEWTRRERFLAVCCESMTDGGVASWLPIETETSLR